MARTSTAKTKAPSAAKSDKPKSTARRAPAKPTARKAAAKKPRVVTLKITLPESIAKLEARLSFLKAKLVKQLEAVSRTRAIISGLSKKLTQLQKQLAKQK
jgi:hypothetical protein